MKDDIIDGDMSSFLETLIVVFGNADLPPFSPCERIIAAAPNACPMATVLTGGRMYFITLAMANASVSNPTDCLLEVVPLELMNGRYQWHADVYDLVVE